MLEHRPAKRYDIDVMPKLLRYTTAFIKHREEQKLLLILKQISDSGKSKSITQVKLKSCNSSHRARMNDNSTLFKNDHGQ